MRANCTNSPNAIAAFVCANPEVFAGKLQNEAFNVKTLQLILRISSTTGDTSKVEQFYRCLYPISQNKEDEDTVEIKTQASQEVEPPPKLQQAITSIVDNIPSIEKPWNIRYNR